MKICKKTVIIILSLCLLLPATGCGRSARGPEATLERFGEALKNLDVPGVRACLCREWNESLDAVLPENADEQATEILLNAVRLSKMLGGGNELPDMELEIGECSRSGKQAFADARLKLRCGAVEFGLGLGVTLCLEDDNWVICDLEVKDNGKI